jgi:hypothetical protein
MNEPRKANPTSPTNTPPPEHPSGDSAYAEAYSAGYGEGLRESLREMLQHASRGHTATELRILIESRLARIQEDVEVKRKSLTGPPRRPAWGPLLRTPLSPSASQPPTAAPSAMLALPPWRARVSYLFTEERPRLGREFALRIVAEHPIILWVSQQDPPAFGRGPSEGLIVLRPTVRSTADGRGTNIGPQEISSEIQRAAESGDRVLVYLDSLETLTTEFESDVTLRFASWLAGWGREHEATVVVSVDPKALPDMEYRRLQRSFDVVTG